MSNLPSDQALRAVISSYPEADADSVQTGMTFLHTAAKIMRHYEDFFAHYGLSAGKFTVMLILQQSLEAALTPSECAKHAGVSRGTISGLLNGLEREGLIFRKLHPEDGRMAKIQLSESGRKLLERLLPDYLKWTAILTSALSEPEKKLFKRIMGKLHTRSAQFCQCRAIKLTSIQPS
ncbi:MAG: MarR family transcriptional regulator [Cyanothece sp. SIO1E1]|nr:MarR family transcriptional regulator [Cyanothece sp. SIO1E1]